MPQIIASIYEIIQQIGSGGGGVVYLGKHIRLNKKIILKADKRKLSDRLDDELRREVEALKDLSHTYIPQVYDFVTEDDVVYTVMDYIEGESFNKPLERGEHFSQIQVIKWARELLEALKYLHGKHPRHPYGILHSDIKPANIMLTPQGDIRLIDFNIALALGEEGAVAVGRSMGYASPEHYVTVFHSAKTDLKIETTVQLSDVTETIQNTGDKKAPSSNTSGKKTIILDVRSDIYGLGATLYHLLTGRRPANKSEDVIPLSEKEYSPRIAQIINKAMSPNPALRYQTAEEMLYDINHLHESDPRSRRHKRVSIAAGIILTTVLAVGVFAAFVGLKQMEWLQSSYVFAEYSANALAEGDVPQAVNYALQALPERNNIFIPPHTSQAQSALANALGVYDLSDGYKPFEKLTLPSKILGADISQDGKTAIAVYSYEIAVFDTDRAEVIATLPTVKSALAEAEFISDNLLVYSGETGLSVYDTDKKQNLWTGEMATGISVSADKTTIAAVFKDESKADIYNIDGTKKAEISFGDKKQRVVSNDSFANPNDNLFALNRSGTLLGISFSDGSLWIYDLEDSEGNMELFDDTSGYTHFEGGFSEQYFAFSGSDSTGSVFAVIDTLELEQTGGFESTSHFGVQTDESGIFVQTENLLVKIHPVTGEQTALVDTAENIIEFARSSTHTLVTSKNEYMFFDKNANLISSHEKEHGSDIIQISEGTATIGSLDAPAIRIMKLENHHNDEVFAYDPSYNHDEAKISADGETVMLFSYDKFRLYGLDGNIITEVSIPDAEQLYDQQYRRDDNGSYLEVIYNDGTIRAYSAKDGSELYKTMRDKPDLTLYEEFLTDTLRIESPLHGVPAAYDRESGKLIRELEKDAYLTYVTEVGEYIITEYVTAQGSRYGLLMNAKCETLAYLPNLCDIVDNELIFDYPTGNLRRTRFYHIDELIGLAREQKIN